MTKMVLIYKSYRPFFVILAVFVLMLMAVNHHGEFPLIDDWAYAHGVSDYLYDGVLKISDWVAMTQVAHLFAGVGWSLIFGYSLENLREFTLLVSLIGAFLMYVGTGFFTKSVKLRLIGTCVLVVNPIWIYLSHTFMTDIPFTVLFLGLIILILVGMQRMAGKVGSVWALVSQSKVAVRKYGQHNAHIDQATHSFDTNRDHSESSAHIDQATHSFDTNRDHSESSTHVDQAPHSIDKNRDSSERYAYDYLVFAMILIFGVMIVLVRQTGLGIGLSLLLWVLLMDTANRRRFLVPAMILAVVQVLTLVGYEMVMSDVGALSTRYHGASSLSWILSRDWWVIRAGYYGLIQLHYLGMFLLPLLPFVVVGVWRRKFPVGAWVAAGVLVLGIGASVGGDILMNPRYTHLMQYDTVGHVMTIDFTYELLDFSRELYPFWVLIHILGLMNIAGWILLAWNPVIRRFRSFPKMRLGTHPVYWMILILIGYSIFISIGQFVFDRYLLLHIPLLVWILIALIDRNFSVSSIQYKEHTSALEIYNTSSETVRSTSVPTQDSKLNYPKLDPKIINIAVILLMLSFLFGITGTHDSFEWNRVRFGAINDLIESGITPNQIDGGAEYNSWMKTAPLQPLRMHEKSWWYVDGDEYAIAFHEIPGYERLRSYEFSKYYGLKTDTIWVVKKKIN